MFRGFLRQVFFSLSFLLLFSMNHIDFIAHVPVGEHPLVVAWEGTGIAPEEIEVEGWKKIDDRFSNLATLQKKAEEVKRRLRLKTDHPLYCGEEPGFVFVNLDGFLPGGSRVLVTFQAVRKGTGEEETHCGLTAFAPPVPDLRDYLRRLERAVTPITGDFPFKAALRGQWPGRLTEEQATELMEKVFARLRADLISGGPAGVAGQWLGCSHQLGEGVRTEAGRVNLEFAYRYDVRNDVTHVILGTPRVPYGL